ncbi:MAG: hypothetical protein HY545_01570 [Candidatus Doudnabacteria bacterium]|nr:hypothetical protein [Candidatus Doudnabacteria bacterium]
MFDLKTPIENLYLVGPSRAKILKRLDIHTLGDLLFYFPCTSRFAPVHGTAPFRTTGTCPEPERSE